MTITRTRRSRVIMTAVALVTILALVEAQELGRGDRRWLEEEVGALITREEVRIFTELRSGEDRELFKELFWIRRDPDLMTTENEFEEEFRKRVTLADRHFKGRRGKGSTTDVGQVYILLGAPASGTRRGSGTSLTDAARDGSLPVAGPGAGVGGGGESVGGGGAVSFSSSSLAGLTGEPKGELHWSYRPEPRLGIPDGLALTFQSDRSAGWTLEATEGVVEVLEGVKALYVLRPEINYERDADGRLLEPPSKYDPKSPAKQALREMTKNNTQKSEIEFETERSFFRATKGSYIPLRFGIDPERLSWDKDTTRVTVFGEAQDPDGATVLRFEEQASLVRAGEAPVTFDVPVVLSTGAYTLHLGVLDDRSGRWGASRLSLFVPEFDTGGLQMSTTVLYTEQQESQERSPSPGNAFHFGRTRFTVPRDRTLRPTDTAGVLFFVYGFGSSPAGSPELVADYIVSKDGRVETELLDQPLQASERQAVGTIEIPLANYQPGSFTVDIRVKNRASEESVEGSVEFLLEPEVYSLGGYEDLIGHYRAGKLDLAARAASAIDPRSLERAARRYRNKARSDEELTTAVLFHTEVGIALRKEPVHFEAARAYLEHIGDASLRRSSQRLWYLAVAHRLASSSTAWGALPIVYEAQESFAEDPEIMLAAAIVYECVGANGVSKKLEEAKTLYRAILEEHPDHGEARIRLGRVMQLQQRNADALSELRRGLVHTTDPVLQLVGHVVMGHIYDREGNTTLAAASFRDALDIDPGSRVAAIGLSRVLDRAGQRFASREVIAELFRSSPDRRDRDLWTRYVRGTAERVDATLARLKELSSR